MGVKFAREYEDIIKELINAITDMQEIHEFIGLEKEEWNAFSKKNKIDCVQTLADDLFFGLSEVKEIEIGNEVIRYDEINHTIAVIAGAKTTTISLI